MKKVLIFDFDGLMLDTEYVWFEAYNKWFMDRYNKQIAMEDFVKAVGTTNDVFLAIIKDKLGIDLEPISFKKSVDSLCQKMSQNLDLMPGVKSLLDLSQRQGYSCFIVSNSSKEWIMPHLERLNLLDYFVELRTPQDINEHKPSPLMYQDLIKRYKLNPQECVIFEDSTHGLLAGNKANIDVVIVENRVTNHFDYPETYLYKLQSLEELDKSIFNIEGSEIIE